MNVAAFRIVFIHRMHIHMYSRAIIARRILWRCIISMILLYVRLFPGFFLRSSQFYRATDLVANDAVASFLWLANLIDRRWWIFLLCTSVLFVISRVQELSDAMLFNCYLSCSFYPLRSPIRFILFLYSVSLFTLFSLWAFLYLTLRVFFLLVVRICCHFIKCIVGFGALAVLVLQKLLISFISCRCMFLFCFASAARLLLQLLLGLYFLFLSSVTSVFILFALNHFTRVAYFIRLLAFCVCVCVLFTCPVLLPRRCNFRLFAVRLYFFIFHINIIDGYFIFSVSFTPIRSIDSFFSFAPLFFPFRIHLTECLLCPLPNQFIFCSCKQRLWVVCFFVLFRSFHCLFPLYTIDGSL